jgi:hypothetical protein
VTPSPMVQSKNAIVSTSNATRRSRRVRM